MPGLASRKWERQRMGSFSKRAAISVAKPLWRLTPTAAKAKYVFGVAGCLKNSQRSLGGPTARPDTCTGGQHVSAASAAIPACWKTPQSLYDSAAFGSGKLPPLLIWWRVRSRGSGVTALIWCGTGSSSYSLSPSAQEAKDEPVADTLLAAVKAVSSGSISGLKWRSSNRLVSPVRAKTSDLDIFHADDPLLDANNVLADLKAAIPAQTGTEARAALSKLRLVAVSRHRLWLAAPNIAARDAVGTTPGARAAQSAPSKRCRTTKCRSTASLSTLPIGPRAMLL